MRVTATTDAPAATGADTIAVGLFEGERIAHDVGGGVLQGLVDAGEARAGFKKLALAHAEGRRWLIVGLGSRERFDAERARVAAAVALNRARELGARALCWELPHHVEDAIAAGLVEGTVLGDYRYDVYKQRRDDDEDDSSRLDSLGISAHHDVAAAVDAARVVAEAQNAARDLQNAPANELTPTRLAERATALAEEAGGIEVEVWGPAEIEAAGMGAFAAVARGSEQEPRLLTLTYDGGGPVLGLVGKAVTFDSGGISIKPAAKMHEMKFDMSGGAAVIAALSAIARLRLPLRVIGVVGATENMPSGRSVRPGDIVRARNGTSIEVNNTDAEGRLVLADCLTHAVERGAERLVDIATLTGAIVVSLGSTYAGLMGTDDAWCEQVALAGDRTGELLWRLPLHPEYAELIRGRYGDIVNAVEQRKAGSIVAAEFLKRFTANRPWAHVDIAGTAWDTGKAYAAKGGSGFGVRLLVDLARAVAARS